MRRAYIVTGAESSGTCFLTQLLLDAGCVGKAGGHQPYDATIYGVSIPEPRPSFVAVQRSIPHAQTWVNLGLIVDELRRCGYFVTMLLPVRDPHCQQQSQLTQHHAESVEQYTTNITAAWREAFAVILGRAVDFVVVPYQSLEREQCRRWLEQRLGLPDTMTTPFVDGDAKYLEASC